MPAMNKRELAQLIQNFRAGKATEEEKRRLEAYWDSALSDTSALDHMLPGEQHMLKSEIFNSIKKKVQANKPKTVSFYRPLFKVAAAILLLVAVSSALPFCGCSADRKGNWKDTVAKGQCKNGGC